MSVYVARHYQPNVKVLSRGGGALVSHRSKTEIKRCKLSRAFSFDSRKGVMANIDCHDQAIATCFTDL